METRCTYLCPLRTDKVDWAAIRDFKQYWKTLIENNCEVLVVDGSPSHVFEVHAREWTNCRHIKVDPQLLTSTEK